MSLFFLRGLLAVALAMGASMFARAVGCSVLAVSLLFGLPDRVSTASVESHSSLRIVIYKSRQLLDLYQGQVRIRTYRVCLGLEPWGPKRITGDRRTPEGEYFICLKTTASKFHRFLGISYPGETDAQAAFESGIISRATRDDIIRRARSGQAPPWDTKLGGWVGIHGYPTDDYKHTWISLLYPKPHNWTDGCIAMWNFEVEELFSAVTVGTPVTITP